MIINSDILKEIDRKAIKIESVQRSDLASLVKAELEEEAVAHSYLLEEKKKLDETNHIVIGGLEDAWKYTSSNFNGKLSDQLIIKTAYLVDPRNSSENYRTENLTIGGIRNPMLPLNSRKISRDMSTLISKINHSDELHTVEKAGLIHLHLSRIHPFIDGNGRTARLLQNLLLQDKGYTPATIKKEERDFYQGVLRNAMKGYKEREGNTSFQEAWESPLKTSDKESLFYEFIASKINLSLEDQLKGIKNLPVHIIKPNNKNPSSEEILKIKNDFQKYMDENEIVGIAKIIDENGTLDVSGYISENTINSIISTNHNYSLESSKNQHLNPSISILKIRKQL
jgi:Fic family protein